MYRESRGERKEIRSDQGGMGGNLKDVQESWDGERPQMDYGGDSS